MGDDERSTGEESAYGDVGTALLHEDERMKIWEMVLEPGEESALHEHTMDYMLVVIEGGRIAGDPHPRSAGEFNEYIEVDTHPGDFFVIRKGGIEVARNVGTTRYRELLIEFKDS